MDLVPPIHTTRVNNLGFIDEEHPEEVTRTQKYEELVQWYYLPPKNSKVCTLPWLMGVESGDNYGVFKKDIMPYLVILEKRHWVLAYSLK